MRPIVAWQRYFKTVVQIAPRIANSFNTYGKPNYGTAVSYNAHLQGERSMVRQGDGQQMESSQSLHLGTADLIDPGSLITLSTGDTGSTESWAIHPPIVSVDRRYDANGAHHTVIRLR